MAVERREEHVKVVSYNNADARPVTQGLYNPASTTTYQTETVVRNPMAVERREDHVKVVSYETADVRPVTQGLYDPAPATTYQTETVVNNPYVSRVTEVAKIQQAIFLLFGILEALLGIRFVLGLLGANPGAGFAQLIYGITGPFLAPFVGLFGEPRFGGMIFEWNALIAIFVYVLIAALLAKLVALAMGSTQSGTYTSTSRIDSV